MQQFRTSRITIGRALRELVYSGLVERFAGLWQLCSPGSRNEWRPAVWTSDYRPRQYGDFRADLSGDSGAPRAAPHALLWGSAAPNHVSAEAQALELSEQFLLRVPHIAFCQQTESLGETLYPRFLGASGS